MRYGAENPLPVTFNQIVWEEQFQGTPVDTMVKRTFPFVEQSFYSFLTNGNLPKFSDTLVKTGFWITGTPFNRSIMPVIQIFNLNGDIQTTYGMKTVNSDPIIVDILSSKLPPGVKPLLSLEQNRAAVIALITGGQHLHSYVIWGNIDQGFPSAFTSLFEETTKLVLASTNVQKVAESFNSSLMPSE
jgi:hypothetical protein